TDVISEGRERDRATTTPSTKSPATRGSHGRPLGPGTQSSRPRTATSDDPYRSTTVHAGLTVWNESGSARTAAGGEVPIQWTRWSCQRAVCEPEMWYQCGGVDAPVPSAIPGTGVVPARVRLR